MSRKAYVTALDPNALSPYMKLLRHLPAALLVAAAAGLTGYQYLRGSLPQISGVVPVAALGAPAEILRDANGVPHISAASLADANFALGYAHAQDRLWQMEVNRRLAQGRLSEVFGASTLDTDRFMRTLGVHRAAVANFHNLDNETQAVFRAYADGVNAYLRQRSGPLPPEFLIFRHTPESWQPADSLAWVKMMAWDLSTNWRDELLRLTLSARLTPQQIGEFFAPYPGDAPQQLPDLRKLFAGMQQAVGQIAARAPQQQPEGVGSNNWAVSGARSVTGMPLLANDPHLALSTPALWYLAHLHAPGLELIGASVPGIPMVALGRNDRIAWGFTNTGADNQDLYLERAEGTDANAFVGPQGPVRFESRTEIVKVKGGEDVKLRVRLSRHGPVISDAFPEAAAAMPRDHVLSLAWTALREDDLSAQALVKLPLARDWESFVQASCEFHAAQQNIVYADVEGNLGFIAPARVPVRRADNELKGLAPAPGWDDRYDWQGFVPCAELPRALNPAEGRISTANDKIVAPDYPHWITSGWQPPFRATRIRELLDARPRHDLASFRAMQADELSLYMREIIPLMLRAPLTDPKARALALRLGSWDARMSPDRPEPLIAAAWVRELTRAIYADELGELFERHWLERPLFMLNVLKDVDGQSRWCDDVKTPAPESCAQRIALALERAVRDLEKRYGPDSERWRWRDAHPAVSAHRPLSNNALLAGLFETRVPMAGDTWTVNVGRISIADEAAPFVSRHAAGLRALYDLADPDRSVFIQATGQSGNPFSPFYRSLSGPWARGEYVSMSTRPDDYEAHAAGRLILKPAR